MKLSHEMIGKIIDIVEDYIEGIVCTEDAVITGKDYDTLANAFKDVITRHAPLIIKEMAVSKSHLQEWYQASVTDNPPVWTDDHIDEVYNDFYLIPKENKTEEE